jgi:signal transduction histidine kinase
MLSSYATTAASPGGLTALRDRVGALGGRLDVISRVDQGTVLRAEL